MDTITNQQGSLLQRSASVIQVIGVGGAGCRAASEVWRRRMSGVSVLCVETDALELDRSHSDANVLLGASTMRGFGSGGDARAVVNAAAERSRTISGLAAEAKFILIVAGMTGTTGANAAPPIAQALRDSGKLVIGVPLMPLALESVETHLTADDALRTLRSHVDTICEAASTSTAIGDRLGVPLSQLFDRDRASVAAVASVLAGVCYSGSERSGADAATLQSMLCGTGGSAFGTATGTGASAISDAATPCVEAVMPGVNVAQAVERAFVLIEAGYEISISQMAMINSIVEARLGANIEIHQAVRKSRLFGDAVRISLLATVREVRRPQVVVPAPAYVLRSPARPSGHRRHVLAH